MITLALKYWKQIGIGLLVLALAIYIGSLKIRLGSAQGEVAKLKGEQLALKSAYATLEKAANECKSSVEALASASAALKAKSNMALTVARKKQAAAMAEKAWLQDQLAKPDRNGKTCDQALKEWGAR
jgi:predicted  nucleic acid-binding Zn-ribbon protein